MKLAMTLRVTPGAGIDMETVWEAERLGFEAVWAGEAYGTDAVSPVAWVLAQTKKIKAGTGIMQMPARTPACAAMTAMTLQALSGNRFLCGIGPSGPQVVEGWHGVPFGKPLARTREYIAIIRQILERKAPLEFHGAHYDIPYQGPGASGLGKPLRSIVHGDPSLKIYTAAVAPAGLRTAGEVADGTLPFFMSPEKADAVAGPVLEGIVKAGGGKTLADFDLSPISGSRSGTTSPFAATRSGPISRSTSAAWARGRRTTTTTSPGAWATRRRRCASRTSTSTASARRRRQRCPTH
jgi:F420-dependent oxidoreductase-like protein